MLPPVIWVAILVHFFDKLFDGGNLIYVTSVELGCNSYSRFRTIIGQGELDRCYLHWFGQKFLFTFSVKLRWREL